MSFSVCSSEQLFIDTYNNMCLKCSSLSCKCFDKIDDNSKSTMIYLNPRYYNDNQNDTLGRISFYKRSVYYQYIFKNNYYIFIEYI